MKKYISSAICALGFSLSSTQASAFDWNNMGIDWGSIIDQLNNFVNTYFPDQGGGSVNAVPELSATAGPLAAAVILGIVAIGFERRRRKNKD